MHANDLLFTCVSNLAFLHLVRLFLSIKQLYSYT